MTAHPEISHLAKEERIAAIAYSLWEEEGRPDGRAEAHWLRAVELVEAEARPTEVAATLPAMPEPDWLQRETTMSEDVLPQAEKTSPLDQLAKRIAGIKAA